jgi:uncharacterized membrane protein YobD (UPF0266 family)
MDKFTVILPNERAATYKWVTIIVAFLSMIFLGYIKIKTEQENIQFFSSFVTIWLSTSLILLCFRRFRDKAITLLIPIFASSLLWIFTGFYLLGILSFIFTLFGFLSSRKLKVKLTEAGVIYPSFPSKWYPWEEVDQVLIKDNILTVDLKNNKLIQISISEKENEKLDVKEFNDYCSSMLKTS